jgi:predicted dehydrogenase
MRTSTWKLAELTGHMKKLRVGVIGVGHLGRHHARIFAAMPNVALVGVADSSAARCAEVAVQCGVPAYEDYRALVSRVDAASIVVPTSLHFDVASAFANAGKSVLVEKPLTADLAQAEQLVELAERRGAILQVGHIERFNPVLATLPENAERPRLIEARRVGPYSFRSTDVSIVFDLMIHDLDIVLSIVGEMPDRIEATAWSVFGGHDDVASARLHFPCGTEAHLTASRADVQPSRTMTIRWTHSFAQLDFAARRSVVSTPTAAFRTAHPQFTHPPVKEIASLRDRLHKDFFQLIETDCSGGPELLAVELEHFVACIRDRQQPRVNGARARDAVQLAAAIIRSAHGDFTLGLAKAA